MRSWSKRSKEVANLFNPPFCCATLTASVVSYSQENGNSGMPFPIAFIGLPVIFHKQTRKIIPINTRTSLAAWLEENPSVRIQFYERVITIKPFVREAILFGIQNNWLSIKSGNIFSSLNNSQIKTLLQKTDGEARECIMKARLLGKWFALAGSPEAIMALWEVRP
jgi:hypothetical protein